LKQFNIIYKPLVTTPACQNLNVMSFSQLREPFIQSKDTHESHINFIDPIIFINQNKILPIYCTYFILDTKLCGLFHPSYSVSTICIFFFSLELKVPYIFFSHSLLKF
jgi:hypothetical protein